MSAQHENTVQDLGQLDSNVGIMRYVVNEDDCDHLRDLEVETSEDNVT